MTDTVADLHPMRRARRGLGAGHGSDQAIAAVRLADRLIAGHQDPGVPAMIRRDPDETRALIDQLRVSDPTASPADRLRSAQTTMIEHSAGVSVAFDGVVALAGSLLDRPLTVDADDPQAIRDDLAVRFAQQFDDESPYGLAGELVESLGVPVTWTLDHDDD